jgi:hypothetical protein
MARFMYVYVLSVIAVVPAYARSLYDLTAVDIDGKKVSMSDFKGHVSVIMNVATQ